MPSPASLLFINATPLGSSQSEGRNQGHHQLFKGKNWWESLSVERQKERLLMSYQLRNDDAYKFRAENLGPHYNYGEHPMIE